MIEIKEHNRKIRLAFKERFHLNSAKEARDLMDKFMDYKETHTKGIIAEQVAEKV